MTEIDVGFGVVSVAAVALVASLITQLIKFLGNHVPSFPKPDGTQTAYIAYGLAIAIMCILAWLDYSPVEQNALIDVIYAAVLGLLSGAVAQGGYEAVSKVVDKDSDHLVKAKAPEEDGAPRPTPGTIAAVAVAVLSILTLVTAGTENPVSTTVAESVGVDLTYPASALTAGQSDLFVKVPKSNLDTDNPDDAKPSRPVSVVAAQAEGQSTPAAPLLGWYNKKFDSGSTQRWCLSGDSQVNDVLRDILNDLNAAFPGNFIWVESCDRPDYRGGAGRAAIDCGMESAVACAVYLGDSSGVVSHNPAYTDGRANRIQILRVAYAHELQHLLDLDHTPCGVNLDPGSNLPVASVMTPVDLNRGSSCSDPPALGLEPSDWYWLYDKYKIQKPSPTPPPAPAGRNVGTELWVISGGAATCPEGSDKWGEYCVSKTSPVTLPDGASGWIHSVEIHDDGTIEWIGEWQFIGPRQP